MKLHKEVKQVPPLKFTYFKFMLSRDFSHQNSFRKQEKKVASENIDNNTYSSELLHRKN